MPTFLFYGASDDNDYTCKKKEYFVKSRVTVIPQLGAFNPARYFIDEVAHGTDKMEFDLDHRRVERPETEDEVKLKEEINALKELAKQNNDGKSRRKWKCFR